VGGTSPPRSWASTRGHCIPLSPTLQHDVTLQPHLHHVLARGSCRRGWVPSLRCALLRAEGCRAMRVQALPSAAFARRRPPPSRRHPREKRAIELQRAAQACPGRGWNVLYFFAGARPRRQQPAIHEKVKWNPCRDRPLTEAAEKEVGVGDQGGGDHQEDRRDEDQGDDELDLGGGAGGALLDRTALVAAQGAGLAP
jgi:hypothetical protein